MIIRRRKIQLTEDKMDQPRTTKMPVKRSMRWWSQDEIRFETTPAISIFATQKAMVNACAFAASDLSNEVGGWLIGSWREDKKTGREFIVIENILPAKHTRKGSAFLTFTHDSQVALLNNLEHYFPGKLLLGWFHTHPRMGIFFSNMDTWLHENFFREHWQVALVIEPVSSQGGFFVQKADGKLDRTHYYGFYELLNKRKKSYMKWINLQNENINMHQNNLWTAY